MPDPIAILLSLLMVSWLLLYVRGWLRLRRRGAAELASVYRVECFRFQLGEVDAVHSVASFFVQTE